MSGSLNAGSAEGESFVWNTNEIEARSSSWNVLSQFRLEQHKNAWAEN